MKDAMTIGADIAKNTFFVVGLDVQGKRVLRKKLTRRKFLEFFANRPPCRVAMEACGGAHHWARRLQAMGHEVVLLPAQHVKAYARGQKNDYNDAEAIAEAALHGRIRPVAIKTLEEQDMQVVLRIRRRLDKDITALVNHLRGLLQEYGVVVPRGKRAFLRAVPELLEDAENGLTPLMREELAHGWQRLQAMEAEMTRIQARLDRMSRQHAVCRRLRQVPGLGPRTAPLLLAHLGDGSRFRRGREAAAALGVIPSQHSTGGKTTLGSITKAGDAYLRSRLVQGVRSVVQNVGDKTDPLSRWIRRLLARVGRHKTVIALVNKIVRIAWAMVRHGTDYDPRLAAAH